MSLPRRIHLLAACVLLPAATLLAADPPAAAPAEAPTTAPAAGTPPSLPTSRLDSKFSLNDKVNQMLAERDKDPIGAIATDMGTAKDLLAKYNTSEPVQPQQKQIVAGLDYLIDMIEKQEKKLKAGGGANPTKPLPDSV